MTSSQRVDRRIALATSELGRQVDPDLALVTDAFAEAEAEATVEVVRWDDPDVDWNGFDLVVVRSCWDYTWRLGEFLRWADGVPRLRNSAEVLRWNVDKSYLRDLGAAGCPVVPTLWDPASADELPEAAEWVVKPSVSAGSRDTARWSSRADVLAHVAELRRAGRTAMVQPYLEAVDTGGETALLHLGGSFSHAVRKGPLLQRGEGVRQDRAGSDEIEPSTARPDQLEVAAAILAAVPGLVGSSVPLLYARVDVVDGPDGHPVLLELELTEPSLFLTEDESAPARLAAATLSAAG